MTNNPATPLLMQCSVDALRRKLTAPRSPLAPWWNHMLALARQDPVWFSPYTVLAAIVTNEPVYREGARKALLRYVDYRAEAETSNEAQYHTHVTSAPLGRWAIFYDWVADMGILSPDEDASFREALLDHAFIFPLQHLQSRMRSFDNQIMANAFGAATVGYVLGMKRGQSALARRLYSSGLTWLQQLIGLLPVGGYSPEGSTYHEQVVTPLTLLAALFIQETTGAPVMEQGAPPANRPVKLLLETSFRMIGPGGLLPAWDAYGFQQATIRSSLAYLARLTGDPAPLALIRATDRWYRIAHPAWEMDDRLWTLVWWPEHMTVPAEATFESWLVPEIAGSLQEPARKIRLYQYWDECGGVPNSGRSQVDPNAITLEAFQSPILLDGSGNPDRTVLPLPVEPITQYVGERTLETIEEYMNAAWGAKPSREDAAKWAMNGSVGMANSLVLDGETWYVPLGPTSGCGEALDKAGPLQVLRSNATAFYTDRYDVSRVARTSAFVRGRYFVVSDRVNASSPHRVTWQAFLREQARAESGRVVIRTAEQVRCDLLPLQEGSLDLTPVPGYPGHLAECRSTRVQHTPPASADLRIDVALVPQSCLAPAEDLTEGWERDIGGRRDTVSLATAYLSDPAVEPGTPRVFRRAFALNPQGGRRYFVQVQCATNQVQLAVNGRPLTPATPQPRGTWEQSTTALPWTFDATAAIKPGENEIVITAPFFHGETVCGPIGLFAEQETLPVKAVRTGKDSFAVSIGSETDQLLLEREGGLAAWAGGETDARHALLAADGTLAAIGVTRLSRPNGFRVHSQAPCDLVWTGSGTSLLKVVDGTPVEIEWRGGRLAVEMAGCVTVCYDGAAPHTLNLVLPARRTVVVNGHVIGERGGDAAPRVALTLTPANPVCKRPASPDEVYALEERCGRAAAEALIAGLKGDDWRVQLACADAIGRIGIREAVPALLERFAEGEAELPYPPLTKWWRASKMLRNPNYAEGVDPSLPMPLAVKRWRVKRAVVTALGKIGDARAAAPIEAALARCNDFFPVTSQLAAALGRIGSPTSIPVLERHYHHAEINTQVHSRLALALLKGEIDRSTFEARVGMA